MATKVFISYSHDSDTHDARVRRLADSLRMFGVECIIDQYEQDWLQGDGTTRMQRWIEDSDFVLVVCTETYKRRFEKNEVPGAGKGAKFEGLLIRNSIYDNDSKNAKFVPVIFKPEDATHRPLILQGAHCYPVADQAGFDRLYAYLTGQNPDPPPPVGDIVPLPRKPAGPTFGRPGTDSVNSPAGPSTVPTPSRTFIKREAITAKIHAALQKNPEQVVVRQAVARAMGGYGKTVAAILYAHEYAAEYPGGRFFLPMQSGDLVNGLASLVPHLGLTGANDPKADAAHVSKALYDGEPSLLILDNVESKAAWDEMVAMRAPGTTQSLLPRGHCRVLVTTRDDAIDPAGAIPVGRLTADEVRNVFELFCGARRDFAPVATGRAPLPEPLPTDAIVQEITTALGGLAVSIAAVAAFMKLKPHLSWDLYWYGDGKRVRGLKNTPVTDLPEVRPEVEAQLRAEGHDPAEHRRALRVIDDAFDALPPAERRAVEYAALLPQDLAPVSWLGTLLEQDAARPATTADGSPEPLHIPLTADPDDGRSPARAALDHLAALDILLPGGEEGKLLSLHRLWHARVNQRARAAREDQTAYLLAIAAQAMARTKAVIGDDVNNPHAVTDPKLRWEVTPLARVCTDLWTRGLPGPAAKVGISLACAMRVLGRMRDAAACLPLSPDSDRAVEQVIGPIDLGAAYCNLATIQHDLGDLSAARTSMERAIDITEAHVAPDHPVFATMYANLALILKDQGDLQKARTSMHVACDINQLHFASEHPTFATDYSNLATIQKAQGDLVGARRSMNRAVGIAERHFGRDHPNLATIYSNLAAVQQAQGELSMARASMERAIDIDQRHFEPDHPNLAIRYSSLATIQQDQGDLAAARVSIDRAIDIARKHFGTHHPILATCLANLATIQTGLGDLTGARTSIESAIAIQEQLFAADHPTLAINYSNLAVIQRHQGDLPSARASIRRAMSIDRKHFAQDHLNFSTHYNNLATICFAEGDRLGTCSNLMAALTILLTHFDGSHPRVKLVRESMKIVGCPESAPSAESGAGPASAG